MPGRFVDESGTDCFLYQASGEKERLKTNLDVHIDHVKNSGVIPGIRLLKLWKARRALSIRQFPFEMLIVQELKGRTNASLALSSTTSGTSFGATSSRSLSKTQQIRAETTLRPPSQATSRRELRSAAELALNQVANSGWETVYGPVGLEEDGKLEKLRQAAGAVVLPSKPWLRG